MKAWQVFCAVGVIAFTGISLAVANRPAETDVTSAIDAAATEAKPEAVVKAVLPQAPAKAVLPLLSAAVPKQASGAAETALDRPGSVTSLIPGSLSVRAEITGYAAGPKLASLNTQDVTLPPAPRKPAGDVSEDVFDPSRMPAQFRYLIHAAWSEVPPAEKPADVVLRSMKDIPVGTPVEEIRRVSEAFGLDFNYMKTVAKIESGFNPNQRTGSYIGLYQLSEYEFRRFGSGEIRNPRDNAVAAAYKIITEGTLFEVVTHRKPDLSDLYLIHQQGWEGAAEHIGKPDRTAWKSMCATSEGREKGEKWCRRAIWGNTLPVLKKEWKSVENVTSAAFVGMWRARVAEFRAKYLATAAADGAKQ